VGLRKIKDTVISKSPQNLFALLRKSGIDYAKGRSNTYRRIHKERRWKLFMGPGEKNHISFKEVK